MDKLRVSLIRAEKTRESGKVYNLEFALLTRPMGVAVPFEGYNRHPSRDGNACFCGALAVDQAALAIGGGPATGMRRDFRPFRANSPSTRQFQKRRIRPSLIMPGVG